MMILIVRNLIKEIHAAQRFAFSLWCMICSPLSLIWWLQKLICTGCLMRPVSQHFDTTSDSYMAWCSLWSALFLEYIFQATPELFTPKQYSFPSLNQATVSLIILILIVSSLTWTWCGVPWCWDGLIEISGTRANKAVGRTQSPLHSYWGSTNLSSSTLKSFSFVEVCNFCYNLQV